MKNSRRNSNLKFNVTFANKGKTALFTVEARTVFLALIQGLKDASKHFGTTDLEPVSMVNVVTKKHVTIK